MGFLQQTSNGGGRERRRWVRPALTISIAIHLLFAAGAAYWVVSRQSARKLTFNAGPKSPNPSERALQHRVQLQKKMTAPVAPPQRILANVASKVALPPMPEMPKSTTAEFAPMKAAAPAAGFGARTAGMMSAGGTGSGAPISFFGIRDVSSNVVIMIDISDSMFGRTGDYDYKAHKLVRVGKDQAFQTIRDEAIKLVQGLPRAANFAITRWSGSARAWQPQLVPATEENKRAAIEHIQNGLDIHKAPKERDKPGGTRHDYALELAFSMQPEGGTIYMLTDGEANGELPGGGKITPEYLYSIVDTGEKSLARKAKLHTIYYVTGKDKADEEQMLRQLANRTGGSFQKVKAQSAKE